MIKKIMMISLFLLLGLTGCTTLPSGENVFENNSAADKQQNEDTEASISLEEAIANTKSDLLEKFWFRAHVANNIEKRRITHMTVNGIVMRPHGYYMNNTFITNPYEYFRWEDNSYLRHNNNWFRGREPEVPFDPFYGFETWEPVLDQGEVIGEDSVLSIPTLVHQIELSGQELLELDSPLLENLVGDIQLDELNPLLNETKIRTLFYVGQQEKSTEDMEILPVIYKYQTWIQMPIPGAGYMEQEIQHFIFRVNEDNIEMPNVENIERYLIEINTSQEQMEEELEEIQEVIEQMEKEL